MSDLISDLENLLSSPGWQWLERAELDHWREQADRYAEQAAGERDDVMALNKLRQILAAKRSVERVFARPHEKIKELTAQKAQASQVPSLSRRGPL